jgi:hypothetical protein
MIGRLNKCTSTWWEGRLGIGIFAKWQARDQNNNSRTILYHRRWTCDMSLPKLDPPISLILVIDPERFCYITSRRDISMLRELAEGLSLLVAQARVYSRKHTVVQPNQSNLVKRGVRKAALQCDTIMLTYVPDFGGVVRPEHHVCCFETPLMLCPG